MAEFSYKESYSRIKTFMESLDYFTIDILRVLIAQNSVHNLTFFDGSTIFEREMIEAILKHGRFGFGNVKSQVRRELVDAYKWHECWKNGATSDDEWGAVFVALEQFHDASELLWHLVCAVVNELERVYLQKTK